jgi:hypothetical protein
VETSLNEIIIAYHVYYNVNELNTLYFFVDIITIMMRCAQEGSLYDAVKQQRSPGSILGLAFIRCDIKTR